MICMTTTVRGEIELALITVGLTEGLNTVMLDAIDPTDTEHNVTPTLKLIDFGRAKTSQW